MARLLLMILLVLSSGPTYAEWKSVYANNSDETIYIDPDTVRRMGDMVEMWTLYDFKTVQSV